MRDPYQVLRQKELDLEQVRKEIQALRVVTLLLSEDKEADKNSAPSQSRRTRARVRPGLAAILSKADTRP